MTTAVLFALPSLFLLLALLAGRFPGEEAIERARAAVCGARAVRRRRGGVSAGRTTHARIPLLPRGGRLVATSLASRPPPPPVV